MRTILGTVAYAALIYGIVISIGARRLLLAAGARIPTQNLRQIARIIGWLATLYGVLIALYLAFGPVAAQDGEHPVRTPLPLEQGLRIIGVLLPSYAVAFFLITTGRRFLLTLLVMLVVIPLNIPTMPSIGLLLVPATMLLALSTVLFWWITGATEKSSSDKQGRERTTDAAFFDLP